MRTSSILGLLALAPTAALSACNADNVLRALSVNSAKASPFCSTYTLPPPNQPLPTYVSQYPASRVSSACTCLIKTTSSSTTSTPTPSPTTNPCKTNKITNGDFETLTNNVPVAWTFAGEVRDPSGNGAYTLATSFSQDNNDYASFYVYNNNTNTRRNTFIRQSTPSLCYGTTYTLRYSSQISITGGSQRYTCYVRISLADQELVYIGPPNGDRPPFDYQTRETTFTYGGTRTGNVFTVDFSCDAPQGSYRIDDISLIGV